MGGAAFIFAGIAEPGVIVHSGGPASITFGELDGRRSQRARDLLTWCERAGFDCHLVKPANLEHLDALVESCLDRHKSDKDTP